MLKGLWNANVNVTDAIYGPDPAAAQFLFAPRTAAEAAGMSWGISTGYALLMAAPLGVAGEEIDASIGSVAVPETYVFGTTKFGDAMHDGFADVLGSTYPNTQFTYNTARGLTGPDATYIGGDYPGFSYADLKPNSPSGLRSFNTQVNNWGLSANDVQAFSYSPNGVVTNPAHKNIAPLLQAA